MTNQQKIQTEFARLFRGGSPFLQAMVKSVEGETCTITLISGLEVDGVRLKAALGEEGHLLLTPKVGTIVLVAALTSDLKQLTVLKSAEVESIEYAMNGLEVLIDSTDKKVQIKNGSASLFDLLNDLSAAVKNLTVTTSTGPSGTPLPTTVAALVAFEQKLNLILK